MTGPGQPPNEPAALSTADVVALLTAALLSGAAAAVVIASVKRLLASLPGVLALGSAVGALARVSRVFTGQRWAGLVVGFDAPPGQTAADAVRREAVQGQAGYRAAYLAAATERLTTAYASGDQAAITAALERETQLRDAHVAAMTERDAATERIVAAVGDTEPDEFGEVLLGWYAEKDPCPRCRAVDGTNFNALKRPAIGWPGWVHPHCYCAAGEPHPNAKRLEQVTVPKRESTVDELRAESKLKYGKGSKLWKYWTSGEGLARYIGKPHPWKALNTALRKEGVPEHTVDGLTTNIMLATPQGRAAYQAGHSKKKRESTMDTQETRTARVVEVREPSADIKPGFTARAVNYGVRDSYGTSWAPGVFEESLRDRLPPVVWGHDWNDPIGRVVAYREQSGGLDIDVELDDLDSVPRAKQAYAQLKSGTMSQFSFAFLRQTDEPDPELRNTTRITKATVDEFSVVLNGSVPNTKTLAVRSTKVPATLAADAIRRYSAGEITIDDALAEVRGGGDSARFEFRAIGDTGDVDPMAVLEEVDASLYALSEELDLATMDKARTFFDRAAWRLSDLMYLLGKASSFGARQAVPPEKRITEPDPAATRSDDADVTDLLSKLTNRR